MLKLMAGGKTISCLYRLAAKCKIAHAPNIRELTGEVKQPTIGTSGDVHLQGTHMWTMALIAFPNHG
jgi:hypothetical protein